MIFYLEGGWGRGELRLPVRLNEITTVVKLAEKHGVEPFILKLRDTVTSMLEKVLKLSLLCY